MSSHSETPVALTARFFQWRNIKSFLMPMLVFLFMAIPRYTKMYRPTVGILSYQQSISYDGCDFRLSNTLLQLYRLSR